MSDESSRIGRWAGVYFTQTEWWDIYFHPLLVQENGDVYLRDTKLTCTFDDATDKLTIPPHRIGEARPMGWVKFSKSSDGRNSFSGVLHPQEGDGPGFFRGMAMLKTQVWGTPVSTQIFIGDHTWITMQDEKKCWHVLGGTGQGGPGLYCGPHLWRTVGNRSVYIPPYTPNTRLLGATVEGDFNKLNCVGGTEGWVFNLYPIYAGIAYALHGVCHQMTNRLLLGSGKFTTDGAANYWLSMATYGIYGTRSPVALVSPLIFIYMVGAHIAFIRQCAECGIPYPGPILTETAAGQRLAIEVYKLHLDRTISRDIFAMTADEIVQIFDDNQAAHLSELRLLVDYRTKHSLPENKVRAMLDRYSRAQEESREFAREAANTLPRSREQFEARMAASNPPVDPIQTAAAINERIHQTQREIADVLTEAEYRDIFDVSRDARTDLVDPMTLSRGMAPSGTAPR
jgi:hypothetical protein